MSHFPINLSLQLHLEWFKAILDQRISQYFENDRPNTGFEIPPAPELPCTAPLDQLMEATQMSLAERVVLLLALAPHVQPQLLDILFTENPNFNRGFTEFGGVKGKKHNGFLPTCETAVFILAGEDIGRRLEFMQIFRQEHFLFRKQILQLDKEDAAEPVLSAPLTVSQAYLRLILWGEAHQPDFGPGFPAKRVQTPLNWSDLVLPGHVMDQILEIKHWIRHEDQIQHEWGLQKWIKPGYRSLFFGPPGTGKTLTASLLGKELARPVYRIDLSMVVSKYIGETEKNLASVFDQAEQQQWILFFDEADALFGKRTETQSAHDRYANQEVSYLLQRVEDFPGLIILASNFKGNLDEAFIRRFQSMIHFPIPGPVQRLILWQQAFSGKLQLHPSVNLEEIAEKFEITGGEIINILRSVAIRAAQRHSNLVELAEILEALRKEYHKSGRTMIKFP